MTIKAHLIESSMSYIHHLKHGFINGMRCIFAGIASFIHAIYPPFFPSYSILTILSLYHEIKNRQHVIKIEKKYLENVNKRN